jgi:hypothetical protein
LSFEKPLPRSIVHIIADFAIGSKCKTQKSVERRYFFFFLAVAARKREKLSLFVDKVLDFAAEIW